MRLAARISGLLLLAACASAELRDLPRPAPDGAPDPAHDPTAPADELPVEPLEENGVRGGRIVHTVPGTPEQVAEMLLDFEDAARFRPWASEYGRVGEEGDTVLASWTFEGRLGMDPTVTLAFESEREGEALRISFHVVESSALLKTFTGDHLLRPWPAADGPATLVTSRVFIASGVPFAGASRDDIVAALRADAKAMRAWMQERLRR